MKYNFLDIKESEYRALDALSYSLLTSEYFKLSDEVIPAFAIGSYVDSMAFNQPLDGFVIENPLIDIPGSKTNIFKFVNTLVFTKGVTDLGSDGIVSNELMTILEETYDLIGVKKPLKSAFIDLFFKDYLDYFSFLVDSIGKTFISAEDDMLSRSLVNELRNNAYTEKYFKSDTNGDIENLFQVPIVANINGIKCKGLLDIVHINHLEKTITPIDLKTTAKDTRYFSSSFIRYKYYIQAALYRLLLIAATHEGELSDYKVLPFKFIPITKNTMRMVPMVYTVNDELHTRIITGGLFNGSLIPFKGLSDLLIEYTKFISLDNGDGYTVEVLEKDGEVELNL